MSLHLHAHWVGKEIPVDCSSTQRLQAGSELHSIRYLEQGVLTQELTQHPVTQCPTRLY